MADNNNIQNAVDKAANAAGDAAKDLENKGLALLVGVWAKIRKYVFIAWGVLTVVTLGISIAEFAMLQKVGKDADKYKKQMEDLQKQIGNIDRSIVSNIEIRDHMIYIEKTNYINLTNLGAKYESNFSIYSTFNNAKQAIRYYKRNANN